jgi:hypothetical protein
MRKTLINVLLAAIVIFSVTFAAFSFSNVAKAETTYVRQCDSTGCWVYEYHDGVLIHVSRESN